jgi:6-pyruvoyltetrahydropterin/6-carboxytetrahydropterin synthase
LLKEVCDKVEKLYSIIVTTNFRAGHQLKSAHTNEPYHIHDWLVEAAVSGQSLNDDGILLDFNKLKKILEGIVCRLDGRKLQENDWFKGVDTSAENIARYIYNSIKPLLPERIELSYVEITEMADCRARYSEKLSV